MDRDEQIENDTLAGAIAFMAEQLNSDARENPAATKRVFDQLTRRLEAAPRSLNLGAHLAITAMFAAGVVAQHCRQAEHKAKENEIDPENVPVILASAYQAIFQHYLQEFFARIELPPLKLH